LERFLIADFDLGQLAIFANASLQVLHPSTLMVSCLMTEPSTPMPIWSGSLCIAKQVIVAQFLSGSAFHKSDLLKPISAILKVTIAVRSILLDACG
jgi:hypothetical protein